MTRSDAKTLQAKYGMEILRDPITSEAWALYLNAGRRIPELDSLVEKDVLPCSMDAVIGDGFAVYKLVCPTPWFDLWGWADER